ncbi:virulence associated protein [Chromobacterium piscinae]|uniref:virulence associated protein n=1 Tax=Chromobacterium piscinae TaxID=686831 RepID=UPI001E4CC151|nr:virulence associated protein [Chromobacterium piscinae]MCD5329373.1 virulence associated protein [Chromobacterium piscinae]
MLPAHLHGLKKSAIGLTTAEGRTIDVWEFDAPTDTAILDAWALHFRRQYCSDEELPILMAGTGMAIKQYLNEYVFPHKTKSPGPSIRSGDFAEFLISDYLEFMLGYWVPRGKYSDKASKDESVKGVDILGFYQANPTSATPDDVLLAFEVKASLSGKDYDRQLQSAVDDGSKDLYIRQGFTLNATKRRLLREGKTAEVNRIARFQNLADNPYTYFSGAVAVLSNVAFNQTELEKTVAAHHSNQANLGLIVVRANLLMKLVHELYDRACK